MVYDYKKDLEKIVRNHIEKYHDQYHLSDPDIALDEVWQDLVDKFMTGHAGYVAPDDFLAGKWASENILLLIEACDYNNDEAYRILREEPDYADKKIRMELSYDIVKEILNAK